MGRRWASFGYATVAIRQWLPAARPAKNMRLGRTPEFVGSPRPGNIPHARRVLLPRTSHRRPQHWRSLMNLKTIAIASAVGSLLALGTMTASADDAKDKCAGIAA